MSGAANGKPLRPDLAVIAENVAPGSRVLDIGCGDGRLLAELVARHNVDARGLEIDPTCVERCVAKGLSVVQGDADRDLADYPDKAFDYAILSQTLQTAARPDRMLDQLLRVGRQAFVSFPNFAHWRMRAALLFGGKMPVTRALPVSWYETQNIHHVTVADFRDLIADMGVRVEDSWFFAGERAIGGAGANWRAEFAVFRLSR
ncbi:methionine biosynthesis protein MetW [Altererythrobacter sp.]|uniref:methionine biosynthesis protein MetW n=1 Tax=Altererythrobacter sp. TaxID=1872480 RepID=UPI003CFE62F3